jgi:hypothetical protein
MPHKKVAFFDDTIITSNPHHINEHGLNNYPSVLNRLNFPGSDSKPLD